MNNLPLCYDPEAMTPDRREEVLKEVYQTLYPWHGTSEASSYDYPTFIEAVNMWAGDDFYIQHFTSVIYLKDITKETPKAGDLVWCFDYPTDPPYHVGNACLYELIEQGEKESKLKRPDNGAIVWFRYIAPYQKRGVIK